MNKNRIKVCVIGGGPAGMMCAGRAAENGCEVTLYEKNERVGRKLAITGKGRCNVTNNSDRETFIENVQTNSRFLYAAYSSFTSQDTMEFFESKGVPLKTERGNRVFPQSDRAYDIVDAMREYCTSNGVRIVYKKVDGLICKDGEVKGIKVGKEECHYDRVAVCTGGMSYSKTGSDGDGYRFAREQGIGVIEPKPSLVPLETEDSWTGSLAGLSLKNVRITVHDRKENVEVYSDFGEMLFTHFGLSGPIVLSASSHIKEMEKGRYTVKIDLKPALDEKTLDKRLLSDFGKNKNRNFSNCLSDLLPQKLIPVYVEQTGIPGGKKVNMITREEREKALKTMKGLECTVKAFRPIEEAIVTSGGIDVREIDPKTMMSKRVRNLYFAGEVIDADAYTGGFNLQIAFCTGNSAGMDMAREK